MRLTKEQIVTVQTLCEKDVAKTAVAEMMGVTEGTVRYHVRRKGFPDGRAKPLQIVGMGLEETIATWWAENVQELADDERPASVRALFDHLMAEHGFAGSYKSVRKYVRQRFPRNTLLRPFRRVETPAGAQAQTDWGELQLDIGGPEGQETLYGLFMVLSHSRRRVVVWCRAMTQLNWHWAHNEAFRRLGGVPAVNRIDNLKTGISEGAGPWGKINAQYRTYARQMRFHIDAHEPKRPNQKGKVERSVGVFKGLGLERRTYKSLEDLQAVTDAVLAQKDRIRKCPATGATVEASWMAEKAFLGPLPEVMPEPFDLVRTCEVHRDCMVCFEGHSYPVPFALVGKRVEVRGVVGRVQILDLESGQVIRQYPRHTPELILIDPTCYEGESTDRVERPRPLGAMSRKLQEIANLPVARRPVNLYAALAEVAR